MTSSPVRDLAVGIFVLLGIGAIAYLSVSLGGLSYAGPGEFELYASFDEVGGLGPRSPVMIGGVTVGRVETVTLDEDFRAKVHIRVDLEYELPDDTSAAILTQGVLGDQYVALEPGGSDVALQSGDSIAYTQSAMILERMIGRFVQNLSGGSK